MASNTIYCDINVHKSHHELELDLEQLKSIHKQLMIYIIKETNTNNEPKQEVTFLWQQVFGFRSNILKILSGHNITLNDTEVKATFPLLSPQEAALWTYYLTTPIPGLTSDVLQTLIPLQNKINNALQLISILCCDCPKLTK